MCISSQSCDSFLTAADAACSCCDIVVLLHPTIREAAGKGDPELVLNAG